MSIISSFILAWNWKPAKRRSHSKQMQLINRSKSWFYFLLLTRMIIKIDVVALLGKLRKRQNSRFTRRRECFDLFEQARCFLSRRRIRRREWCLENIKLKRLFFSKTPSTNICLHTMEREKLSKGKYWILTSFVVHACNKRRNTFIQNHD